MGMTMQPCTGKNLSAAVSAAEAAHCSWRWGVQAACGPFTSTCTAALPMLTSAEGRAVAVAHEVDVQAILQADSQQLSRLCGGQHWWVHPSTHAGHQTGKLQRSQQASLAGHCRSGSCRTRRSGPTCRARGAREAALYRSSHMPRCIAMRRLDSAGRTEHSWSQSHMPRCIAMRRSDSAGRTEHSRTPAGSSSKEGPAPAPAACRKLGRSAAQHSECATGGGPTAGSQPAPRGSRRSALRT